MIYYDGIDVSEGIDVNKKSESKDNICDNCHYRYLSLNHIYAIDLMT